MPAHLELIPLQRESDPDMTDNQNDETEHLAEDYSPDDLEGIATAADRAASIIKLAIENGIVNQHVTETDRGLRGIVEASIADGKVVALFAGSKLDQIDIILDNNGEQTGSDGGHDVRISQPESGNPRIYLDGVPVDASQIPNVYSMLEFIKAETENIDSVSEPTDDGKQRAA